MARIDEVRERYESITEKLYTDKAAFTDYLKYAGKFYKLPAAQTMVMYATNPQAAMVADFDTWQRFGRTVQRGARSIAVPNGSEIKHYFDISQTGGGKKPYQWTLDKQTAQDFVTAFSKAENKQYRNLSGCVNAIGEAAARDSLDNAVKALNISEADRAAFEKSFISITQYFVAARCELDSSFKYKNAPLDLTALDLVHSKAEAEKLTEYVQIAARPALLSMEKTINTIINERSIDNGRNQTDMVRGGQEVLSRNNRGERQDIQARPENVRVSRTAELGTDGRGTGADERADRQMGTGVAEVYAGELPRRNPVAAGSSEMGADTPTDRQGSVGNVGASAETVRSEQSPPDELLRGDREMGENERSDSGTRGNGADSASAQRINNESTAEEEKSSAVPVSDKEQICSWAAHQLSENESIRSAFRDYLDVQQEDEPVYDSITTYEWFKEDVGTAALSLFSEMQQGEISVPNVPKERVGAFVQNYLNDSEERYDIDDTIAGLIDTTLTRLEEVRSFAGENGIPFSENMRDDGDIADPYAYNGSMSAEDSQKAADAHNLHEFVMRDYSDEMITKAATHSREDFIEYFADRARDVLTDYAESHTDEHWHRDMLNSPDYLKTVCDLVVPSLYNELRENIQYPIIVVNGSFNNDFSVEDVGLEMNKPYSVEEFNAALTKANIMWNSDERFEDRLHSVNISVYANENEQVSYQVEMYASYRSIGDVIDTKPITVSADLHSSVKNAVAEIESRTLTDNSSRILGFFSEQHTQAETMEFVKSVYGDWITDKMAEYVGAEAHSHIRRKTEEEKRAINSTSYEDRYPEDWNYIVEKTRVLLGSDVTTNPLCNTIFGKAFEYAYEEKTPIQSIPESELNEIISEAAGISKEPEIPSDIDKFYVNPETESVTWIYYNPDSSAGGQLVYNYLTYDDIFNAMDTKNPLEYMEEHCKQELLDRGSAGFDVAVREFMSDSEDISSHDEDCSKKLSMLYEPIVGIFQLKDGEALRDYRFISSEQLKKEGHYVDRENYDRVYRARISENETLESIYERFNIDRPEDFHGHSLSMGDVVCIKQEGKITAYYVDRFGFTEVPDFTLSREERKARRTLTDNLTLLADNQLASDEMDTLGDKLFRYDNAPKYRGSGNSWLIGAGMTADKFEDITTRYHNGEDVRAELAKGMYGNMTHIEFYEFPPADGIRFVDISTEKTESGMTFRTQGGFEITHSWEALGEALITAARQEFDRHEELDRQYRERQLDNIISKVRDGGVAEITFKQEEDNSIIANANRNTFNNAKLRFGEEYGFYITADTPNVNDGIISVLGLNEQAVKDYLSDKADTVSLLKGISNDTQQRESNIHFGLLGNGITCYDVSRQDEKTHDFLVVAHISNEGNVSYWEKDVSEDDKKRIGKQAEQQKQKFTQEWNSLSADIRYGRIVDEATPKQFAQIASDSKVLSTDEVIKKYEHSVIFKDEDTPTAIAFSPEALSEPVQLSLFGDTMSQGERPERSTDVAHTRRSLREPMHEYEPIERRIIGGVDVEAALKQDLIRHGSGFEDGKFRIDEYYKQNKGNTTEFAKFLSHEYGIGGHSGEGKIVLSDHDSKGISLRIKLDNGDETNVTWSWKKVADRIARLIDNNEYITQADIDRRISHAQFVLEHNSHEDISYQRAMKVLDGYGLLSPEQDKSATAEPEITDLERAKKLIDDFCNREYGSKGNFTDLKQVPLAYTEDEETAQPIQVNADLEEYRLTYLHNNEVVKTEQYGSLAEMNENALNWLNFDELIHEAIEAKQNDLLKQNNGEEQPPIEGTPIYKVGDHIEIEHSGMHYSAEITYIGDTSVSFKPDVGYSWEIEVTNKAFFEENLRKDSRNAHLFSAEKQEQDIELHDVVIDLTARPEREETPVEKHDFTITDEHLGEGGAKTKFAANMAAIKTLKAIEAENRLATPEEQQVLSKYVGWGGISQAFDENNSSWTAEYKELTETLTAEEYTAAQGTVLNAHYTTPTVINAIYKGLETLGFDGGNILEPSMGVGNFFGVMPEEMRQNSRLHGVEIDSITGRIAQQLYQTADIQIKGYEETTFSDNYFDAAIGNVPFGNYSVFDKRYNKENFYIHDYFFAKTLDKVAPNGIVAFVTTKGTLDKQNPKVREYLAKRADLIGAIRLPNNAFRANAGTEVTTDIIFLQKREKMAVELPDWCYVGRNNEGVPVNNYFIDHPEMILGTMKQGVEFSMYGNASETACVPIEGADLKEQLEKAVGNLKLTNAIKKRTQAEEKQAGIIPAVEDVRNFTFAEVDGKMYFRENNIMTEVTETGKKADRIKGLHALRNTFRELLTAQEHNCSDEELKVLQDRLNTQYDRFVKEYGYINDSSNGQVFSRDDDYNSLCALESVDEENKTISKSDFFTKRTVKYTAEITHVETPQEAMQVSIDTRGKMDIPYMAQLCGQEPQQVIDVLKADNLIFRNPARATDKPLDGWEEMSEYLSGDVRSKLRTAEAFAADNPEYQRNVAALTSVLPPKLEAGDISARIGVSWVDVEDYQQFLTEYAKSRFFEPMRRTVTGEYKIENKNWDTSASAIQIYGTSRMPAKAIFENLLNNRDIVVRDKITDPDGREHYEINKKETDLAQEKARQMKEAFKRWLWDDPARREKYVERYNNLFNCIVGRKFDGSHQSFPGMSPSISLKPHQLDAVMRAKFGGNTLLAHCVGAGKSFEMVAATMEKKRLGLINKACVVVPKHLVGQMANEWLRLYPQAKILTATEKDFDKDHRQKFIARCCTGDYDAVIMSYEQFEKIPMSMEYRKNFIQREIDTMQSGIDELSGDYRSRSNNRSSIKDLEREKKRLEARLKKLLDGGKTKDTSLTFEQLGFDSLVVDEAHNYKNGLVVSKMNRVSGVQTRPAQKSEDILMKTQYLNENYGEKNIIFASGTPVSNSMTELYIMQRYLRPSLLENAGLQTFDDWASNFGEVVSKAELKPAGNGYRTKKRFAKFNNVPELMQMFKEFADIRTADMLDLKVPELEGGKPQTIVAKPNEVQQAFMQELAERSEAIHSGAVDPSVDNMLRITGEARLLGLDARCLMPTADNYPDSKVNLCIDKVMEIYQQTEAEKGVQAIFCDIAVSSDDGRFSVYDYIKEELVRRGVPEEEICAAGDAETQKQRNEMYAQLRSGTKRIVLASTSKMGTGANIQTKLAALHNLDIPWKPSDIEQRNGRIIRQGNEFDKVGVYNYVTENTFDAYLMNIIVTKQRFISQLMSGNAAARSCEDVDEAVLNYSEMQALATGDERIKEKIELDGDVARLRLLESEHYNAQYRLDTTISNAQTVIKNCTVGIEAARRDLEFAEANKPAEDEFCIEIGGKVYTERKPAGEALQREAVKVMGKLDGANHVPIGKYCGFELSIDKQHNGFTVSAAVSLRKELTYTADIDISGDIGNITRLENLFAKGIERKLTDMEDRLSRAQTDLSEALAAKGKPFEHADELAEKSARLEQLNRELEVGKAEEVIMNDDEDEVQGNESRSSHEQDNPDNNRPTPPKHSRH